MLRHLLLFSLVFGISSSAWAQSGLSDDAPTVGRTPVWLPRGALLGTYLRKGAVTPQVRLQWQFTLYQARKDALVLLAEGGLGYAVGFPDTVVEGFDAPMDSLYENTLMVGGGYRNQSPGGVHWGFQVTAGPMWYGAHFRDLPDERYTVGLLEGRIHIGHQLGPLVLGASVGYGEPFNFKRRSIARQYTGGFLMGIFADWR